LRRLSWQASVSFPEFSLESLCYVGDVTDRVRPVGETDSFVKASLPVPMITKAHRNQQRWMFGNIAIYSRHYAIAEKVYQSLIHEASQNERMGLYILDNGDRVAWVRLQEEGKENPEQK
jgi:hypothetical protein